MTAFDWTGTNPPAASRWGATTDLPQTEEEGTAAPQLWADGVSLIKTCVSDKPALALGVAFVAGVTLGWMIKR
jgi:hypothetical protein